MTEELERALGGYASIADFQTILIVAKDCARQAGLFEVATEIDRANDIITALTPKAEGVEERAGEAQEIATRMIANVIERAETTGRKRGIPEHVRGAWESVRCEIIHTGRMDDHRFALEDFFNGDTVGELTASPSRERVDQEEWGPAAAMYTLDYANAPTAVREEDGRGAQHAAWMLHEVINGRIAGRKAHRWLGYAQGLLVGAQWITLEEAKQANKRASDEATAIRALASPTRS